MVHFTGYVYNVLFVVLVLKGGMVTLLSMSMVFFITFSYNLVRFFKLFYFGQLLLCISNLTYFVIFVVFYIVCVLLYLASGCKVSMFLTWTNK